MDSVGPAPPIRLLGPWATTGSLPWMPAGGAPRRSTVPSPGTVTGQVDDLVAEPAGFDAAFPTLFRSAYQAAYRILGSRAEAEEVAQEALARSLTRWSRVAPYAEAWVTRTAVNLAIDVYRRRAKAPPPGRAESVAPVDEHVELRADLVRALKGLSRRQRDVVVLRYLFGYSEREIAAALGIATGSVKRHASRGLSALRAEMGPAAAAFDAPSPPDQATQIIDVTDHARRAVTEDVPEGEMP
jgi:RNA polymerase sigma factor (sigma-70 family)